MRPQIPILLFLFFLFILFSLYYVRKRVTGKLYRSSRKHLKVKNGIHTDLYLNVNNGECISKSQYKQSGNNSHINIWYMNMFPGKNIIIYYHGTDCNVSHRKYMFEICKILQLNIVIVDYRGFGKSEGKANSDNVLRDADAVYNFVAKHHSPHKIKIWGESLGGVPAIYIASRRPTSGLLLLSTFTSLHAMLSGNYVLYCIARSVTTDINDNTNNLKMIKKVRCPVLIYHSREDKLIDYENAVELLNAVPHSNKKLVTIKGDHSQPKFTSEDFAEIPKFLGLGDVSRSKVDEILEIVESISDVMQGEVTSS